MRRIFITLGSVAALLLPPSLGTAAEAAGASFTARGNEPFWRAEVTATEITFEPMGAERVTISPKPESKIAPGQEAYEATVDGKPFSLTIADGPCVDTMSGMPFPKIVSVEMGETKFSGCGGDPASLLEGEWLIEEIGGKPIVAESKPSIAFGRDGKIAGNGSCNRYFGPYVLTGEGLKISNLATSMMMCEEKLMEQERLLLKSLEASTRFEIDQSGKLVLLGDGTSVSARRK